MESVADSASSWPWFHLMNEAMEGRLSNSAPLLTPVTQEDDQFPDPAPRHRLPCLTPRECPSDHFSFYVQSGAANIVLPKICIQNRTVLGAVPGNGGVGLNIVVMDGRTGEILKTGAFDMWGGDVQPLVDFLKAIEVGSVVLMASFDDPATKLNEEARNLIADLGSSLIQTLGFRDNWVFVGGKGESVKSNYEKTLKNEREHNKYEEWPEIIDLHGCIPQYLQ
uniref:Uncharacterized LOC103379726 n=1 Tax=Cynoglossus semilaevis TaxID=244447 RepID=A0A3P8X4S4_CYNSE